MEISKLEELGGLDTYHLETIFVRGILDDGSDEYT